MKRSRISLLVPTLLLLGLSIVLVAFAGRPAASSLAASSSAASSSAAAQDAGTAFTIPEPAGNQCLGCHTASDPVLGQTITWSGPVESLETIPCPALKKAQEELYLTDRLLLAIDRNQATLPAWVSTTKVEGKLQGQLESYARLADLPVTSLDAQVSEIQTLRYQLGKIYTQLNALRSQATAQSVLVVAALITLTVFGALFYGLSLTRRFTSGGLKPGKNAWGIVLVLIVIFAFFALPIFRTPVAEVAAATELETERQTKLDEATRAAEAAERAQSRIWMLGEVGAAWQALDPALAQSAFEQTLQLAEEARLDSLAVWGASRAAQDFSAGDIQGQEQAALAASEADAMRSRAWGLRAAAAAWQEADPEKARQLLETAEKTAAGALDPYRDYDLRAIALTWAELDRDHAFALLAGVQDPAVRAWGYRQLGDYAAATAATSLIADPLRQAGSLSQIALASGQSELFDLAQASLVNGQGQLSAGAYAYALSRLAAQSGDAFLLDDIDGAFPAARALAQLGQGQPAAAWESSLLVSDTYEQAHLQALIAPHLEDIEKVDTIRVPALADAALRDIIRNTGASSLSDRPGLVYYQVQNLIIFGDFEGAWERANMADDPLKESAVLVLLACGWSQPDPASAAAVVEQIEREGDKAVALRCIAAATGREQDYERALGMALAARVRGDATAPVRASLTLGRMFLDRGDSVKASAAFQQAYDSALRIAVK